MGWGNRLCNAYLSFLITLIVSSLIASICFLPLTSFNLIATFLCSIAMLRDLSFLVPFSWVFASISIFFISSIFVSNSWNFWRTLTLTFLRSLHLTFLRSKHMFVFLFSWCFLLSFDRELEYPRSDLWWVLRIFIFCFDFHRLPLRTHQIFCSCWFWLQPSRISFRSLSFHCLAMVFVPRWAPLPTMDLQS